MKKQKRVVVYLLILSMILSISSSVQTEAKSKKKASKQAMKAYNYVLDSFKVVEDFVLEVINGEQYYYYKKSNLKKMDKKLRKQLKKGKKIDKIVKTKMKGKKYKTIRKYWNKLRASEKVIQKQAQQGTFQDKKLVQFRNEVRKFHKAYVKLYNNKDYQFLSRPAPGKYGVDGWESSSRHEEDKNVKLLYDNWDTKTPKKPVSTTPTKSPAAPTPTKQPSSAVNPTNAPAGANRGDVQALTELIRTQKERGATVSEDMSSDEYEWENGRLVGIYWYEVDEDSWKSRNLQGDISFSAFTALSSLICCYNNLSSLDVSGCVNLTGLNCSNNQLSHLNVSKNADLLYLSCNNNQLSSLDLSKNLELIAFSCENNKLSTLDVRKNINLIELRCSNNLLSDLDISKNVDLEYLDCEHNLVSTLDISKNINLEELYCDDDVTIISSGTSKPTPDKTYHAYLGFQTNTYAFRQIWNDETYGLDSVYLDYDSEICYWKNNYLYRKNVTITDADISSNGTYTVSISGIDLQTLDTDGINEYFNTLYISTDIPATKDGVQFTDATLLIDNQIVASYNVLPQNGDAKDYYQLMLADIYAPDDGTKSCQYDSTNKLDILPTDSIAITFTVSGITSDTASTASSTETSTVAGNY